VSVCIIHQKKASKRRPNWDRSGVIVSILVATLDLPPLMPDTRVGERLELKGMPLSGSLRMSTEVSQHFNVYGSICMLSIVKSQMFQSLYEIFRFFHRCAPESVMSPSTARIMR
jgi:hypothetical protein